jgi:hypothetical protein
MREKIKNLLLFIVALTIGSRMPYTKEESINLDSSFILRGSICKYQ